MSEPRNPILRILRWPLLALAALFALLEEWLWDSLKAATAWLFEKLPLRWLERWLASASPPLAVLLLLTPTVVILPAKLLGLWLLAGGHVFFGGAVFIAAKLAGMALLSRLYALMQPALHRIGWFLRLDTAIRRAIAWAHAWLDAQPTYVQTRAALRALKASARATLARLLGR